MERGFCARSPGKVEIAEGKVTLFKFIKELEPGN